MQIAFNVNDSVKEYHSIGILVESSKFILWNFYFFFYFSFLSRRDLWNYVSILKNGELFLNKRSPLKSYFICYLLLII